MVKGKKSTTEEQNIMSNWCGAGVSQVNQIRRLMPRLTWEYDVTSVSLYICTRYLQLHGGVKKEEEKTCKKSGEYFGKEGFGNTPAPAFPHHDREINEAD